MARFWTLTALILHLNLSFQLFNPLILVTAQDMQVVFHMLESQLPGTLVGNVAYSFREHLPSDEIDNLVYKFLKWDKNGSSLFYMDSDTGEIYINQVIDREQICAFSKTCLCIIDVSVSSKLSSYFEIVTVKVIIGDVNDNPPTFPASEITLFIPENIIKGHSFPIAGATDMDTGENNSVESYDMVTISKVFDLFVYRKLDGTDALDLVVRKSLDREEKDYYRFFIVAKDGGKPALSGYVIVNVNITDENDNVPTFTEEIYDISVTENTPVYRTVGKVSATDKDSGPNGKVSYRLLTQNNNRLTDFFELDPVLGEISVLQMLQYQTGNTFETIIEAYDHGSPPHTSQAKLLMRILDVGNDAPLVSVTMVIRSSGSAALLSEGAHIGKPVAHVNYIDKDQGPDGKVRCVCFHEYFSNTRLHNGQYVIQVKRNLDRESVDFFNVSVTCRDGGTPSLSAVSSFTISVMDENDNPPVFQNEVYEQSVVENNEVPLKLMRVKAVDKDIGDNAVIYYFLNLMDASEFHINRNTGQVVLHKKLDREAQPEITYKVLAIDGGDPSLTGTAEIVIKVIDQNDNFPAFIPESLVFYVSHDVKIGAEIGKIKAFDQDSFQNGLVEFTVVENYSKFPFTVYSNGIITLSKELNYNLQTVYSFPVIAKDGGNPPKTTSSFVKVHIIDPSVQSPTMIYANDTNHSIYVPIDSKPGSVIGKIVIPEIQLQGDSDITFHIINPNFTSIFKLLKNSGDIVLVKPIKLSQDHVYSVPVEVYNATNRIKKLWVDVRIVPTSSERHHFRKGYMVSIVAGSLTTLAVVFLTATTVIMIYISRIRAKSGKTRKGVCVQEETRHISLSDVRFQRHGLSGSLGSECEKDLDIYCE